MPRPLIPLLFFLIAGITAGSLIHMPALPVMIFLLIFVLVLLAAAVRMWKIPIMVCIAASLFLLGILNINLYLYPHSTPMNICNYAGSKEKCAIEGIICKDPQVSPYRTALTLETIRIIKDGATIPVEGKILLSVRGGNRLYKYGDLIRVKTRPKRPHNFKNPSGFDYERYLKYRGIRVCGFVDNPSSIVIIRENQGNMLKMKLEKFRSVLRKLIEEKASFPEARIIQALILGERKEIPGDIRESFNRAGVSHILAISGFHIGMVAFFSILIVRYIMKSSEYLLLRFNIYKVSAVFSLVPVITYAFIAGFGISTVRATIMILAFLTAILCGRERDLFNILALAALVILTISPPSLFDISFQLSFTAVASILFIAPRLSSLIPKGKPDGEILRNIILFIIVSLSATLGTVPLIAFYFNRISTVVLLSNIIIVPIMGFIVLPLGMATIITAPISTALAGLLIKISSFFVGISISIIDSIAALPMSSFFVTTPTLPEIAAYYLLLITSVKLIEIWGKGRRLKAEGSKLKVEGRR
jgi:competence protein ComEC